MEIYTSFHQTLASAMAREKHSVREFLWGFGEAILLAFVASGSAIFFPVALGLISFLLPDASVGPTSTVAIVLSTAVLAGGAYFFFKLRASNQALYGAIELGVGVGMAVASAYGASKGARHSFVLQAMAAMYVLIRGMVNLTEGRANQQASARDYLAREALERHPKLLALLSPTGKSVVQ